MVSISSWSGASSFLSISPNSQVKSIKCLKHVFRWASSLRLTIFWKWEWYIWAYTRNSRLNIVFTTSLKLVGNGEPSFWGNMDSSSSCDSIQSIRYSTYFGAETSIGFLICTPSAHLYSYLGPADIVRQFSGVQNSVRVP